MAKAEFERRGVRIQVLDRTISTDRSTLKYGYAVPEPVVKERIKAAQDKDAAEIERIRGMAATMTMRDVMQATGIGRGKLRVMGERNGFTSILGTDQKADKAPKAQKDPAEDARNAERLKAFSAAGVTRQQAARHMRLSMKDNL